MQDADATGAAGADDLQAAPRTARRLGRAIEIDPPHTRREGDLSAEADITAGEQAVLQADAIGLTDARDRKCGSRLEGSPADGVDAAPTAGVTSQGDRSVVTADRCSEPDAVVSRSGRQGPPTGRGDRRRLTVDVDGAPGVHRAARGDEDAVIGPVGRRLPADADRTAGREARVDGAQGMRKTHAAFGRFPDEADITSGGDDGFTGAARIDAPVGRGHTTGEETVTGGGDVAARGDAVGEIDAADFASALQRDGARRRQRRARLDMDTRVGAARIAGESQITGVAPHRGGQEHGLAAGEASDGPPVRDAGRRIGAIKGDVTEGGDGSRRGRVEATIVAPATDRDADGPAGSRRGRVASQDRRTEIRARPLGVHGDPDIARLRPDGLIRDRHVERHDVGTGAD